MSSRGEDDRSAASTERRDRNGAGTSGPPTTELRIDAVEAAVAAGLVEPAPEGAENPPTSDEPVTAAFELPDWAEPPTGQIPRVLLDDPNAPLSHEPVLRKPTWRAQRDEWKEDEFDLSLLAPEPDDPPTGEIAGTVLPDEAPFAFSALDEPPPTAPTDIVDGDEGAWNELFTEPVAERRRHSARRHGNGHGARRFRTPLPALPGLVKRASAPTTKAPRGRNGLVATATGLGLGLVAALCLLSGAAPTDGLIAVLGTVAAGEFFAALQRGGYHPATVIGLLAVPACVVAGYIDGPSAIAVVVAVAFVTTGAWFLRHQASEEPIVDAAVTVFVVTWVGVLAGFAALLLAPAVHPHRHGVALVFGVIACTVAHDVGSYLVGSRLGSRRIAPRISPGKTVEGVIGGTVLDLVVALTVVSRIHPFSIGTATVLGVIVAVFAPLGDLIESMVKRDLGVKDMGSLLPAHGGVFDRVDAMLVAMPAAYLLFRMANVA